jgi:hypothetical protein
LGDAFVHVLDDLEGCVDVGSFDEEFYEAIEPFIAVDYLEFIYFME